MGIRVAYGDSVDVQAAIDNGIIPTDSIIIAKNSDSDTELIFYDEELNLSHIVSKTKFLSVEEAISYALDKGIAGKIITVLTESVYLAYIVQPDYSLIELGMGKYRPETIEELISDVYELKQVAHYHDNKFLLDSITKDRMEKWDTGDVNADSLPPATINSKGVVLSSDLYNNIKVSTDGTMTVNDISINKIIQTDGERVVFSCGNASD